ARSMAVGRTCGVCGSRFRGRAGALHCSARSRASGKCDGERRVTVLAGPADGVQSHCAEAVAVLAGLDGELAENPVELGERLAWSAAERAVRELIAAAIDRKVWLSEAYRGAGDDVGLRVRL